MTVHLGDCLDVMPTLGECADAVVTDPPYGLRFMGKGWDHEVPGVPFWQAALGCVRPGAYMLTFGGTRKYHRLACAVEDAGWELDDCLQWLFGSGFPKHRSKLKPAYEPIILARRPAPRATPLQIDACRIGVNDSRPLIKGPANRARPVDGFPQSGYSEGETTLGRWPANVLLDEDAAEALDAMSGERGSFLPAGKVYNGGDDTRRIYGKFDKTRTAGYGDSGGASRFLYVAKASRSERWDNWCCDSEAAILPEWEKQDLSPSGQTDFTSPKRATSEGASTGDCSSSTSPCGSEPSARRRPDTKFTTSTRTSRTIASETSDSSLLQSTSAPIPGVSCVKGSGGSRADSAASSSQSAPSTGTSRVKAGRCTGVVVPATSQRSFAGSNCAECGRPLKRLSHPTVKPLDLMRWLVRLITPPGGTVLDPFMGSGSTGCAAVLEGRQFIGIERSPEYCEIAKARIAHWGAQQSLSLGGAA